MKFNYLKLIDKIFNKPIFICNSQNRFVKAEKFW